MPTYRGVTRELALGAVATSGVAGGTIRLVRQVEAMFGAVTMEGLQDTVAATTLPQVVVFTLVIGCRNKVMSVRSV